MAKKQMNILIVDDNKHILLTMKLLLATQYEQVVTLSNPAHILSCIEEKQIDVVFLDMNYGRGVNNGNEGLYWLKEIKRKFQEKCHVVLITAYADIALAVEGMKSGATDFVVKPWNNDNILEILERLYSEKSRMSKSENRSKSTNLMMWGKSKRMLELKEMVERVAPTNANIIIFGENGTGKDMLAREIHRLSERSSREMVTVDMGAVHDTLFESELFGYKKGAFTDAKTDKVGKFLIANGSTLFLDEIGNLSLSLQAKLLAVLQQRKVNALGSTECKEIDIRLISATNKDLSAMVTAGEFRLDLMYRLNTIAITLPPLRERIEDVEEFCSLFVDKYAEQYRREIMNISSQALRILKQHQWRGNIRELEHTIEKAVILCRSGVIEPSDLIFTPEPIDVHEGEFEIGTFEDMEQKMIEAAIKRYDSNLTVVAQSLGVSRQTLYNKMKRYNI